MENNNNTFFAHSQYSAPLNDRFSCRSPPKKVYDDGIARVMTIAIAGGRGQQVSRVPSYRHPVSAPGGRGRLRETRASEKLLVIKAAGTQDIISEMQ